MNVEKLISDNLGKKSILIAGKTGSGKSELVRALQSKYGSFDSMPELRTHEDFKLFRESAPVVSEIHIAELTLSDSLLGEYIGIYCHKPKSDQYSVYELDLESLSQNEIMEIDLTKEQLEASDN